MQSDMYSVPQRSPVVTRAAAAVPHLSTRLATSLTGFGQSHALGTGLFTYIVLLSLSLYLSASFV